MRIARFLIEPYQLCLREPFQSARRSYSTRSGYLVWLYNSEGVYGLGEAAPLPGFSEESFRDAGRNLREAAQFIHGASLDITENIMTPLHLAGDIPLLPSVRFALDTAALDLIARTRRIPFRQLLADSAPASLRVNGVIDLKDAQECIRQTTRLMNAGFTTIKMKVGRRDFDEDIRCVESVRRVLQNRISLRLDANQSWNPQEAAARMNRLGVFDLEYIEQPIPRGNPDGLSALKSLSSVPIAVDEDVYPYSHAMDIIEKKAADVLVLKPAILGSYQQLYSLMTLAQERNISIIFSSALESLVGRSAVIQLAGAFAPESTHGLAPDPLPAESFFPSHPYHLSRGEIIFPQDAGIGLHLRPDSPEEL